MSPLLDVSDLVVQYGDVSALRGVDLHLDEGESLAVVGESGSGKSTLALSLAGLIQPPQARGSVRLQGQELLGAPPELLRSMQWRTVAIALQGAPFNPVVTVGAQIAEPLRVHLGLGAGEALRRARELAADVRLDPSALDRYPHQLSGGERRRATLAMVLALDPRLVVLDEPTTGLDPWTRADLVERIRDLARRRSFALVVVSHDLADAARLARTTIVLYAGEVIEAGDTSRVIGSPTHPYTWALVGAYPVMSTTRDLRPIRGLPPDPRAIPPGCAYHPRCTQAEAICRESRPSLDPSDGRLVACHFGGVRELLRVVRVSKHYGRGRNAVRALDDVSLSLREGEAVGVVGPSGSGKSTLASIVTGHLQPDEGEILLEGTPFGGSNKVARQVVRRIQLVMQDPWDALSPRMTVEELVREPLDILDEGDAESRRAAVAEVLASVGLPTSAAFLRARPHELSGGQLQRVALARALVVRPKLLVADEPSSMLDASEQARLLVVLRERQVEMGLGLLLISHDLAVVRKVTDRILVLDHGRVVEEGRSHLVCARPRSPTTKRLLETAPTFSPDEPATDDDTYPALTGRIG